jgi:hypothetical protein
LINRLNLLKPLLVCSLYRCGLIVHIILVTRRAATILGANLYAGAAPAKLEVRDVWEKRDLGMHTAKFGATLAGHETKVLLLSAAATATAQ